MPWMLAGAASLNLVAWTCFFHHNACTTDPSDDALTIVASSFFTAFQPLQ
jgi:hypothetical protein